MSLVVLDLLPGARVRFAAAAMLMAGCSGGDDPLTPAAEGDASSATNDAAHFTGDAERDAGADAARDGDANVRPADADRPEVISSTDTGRSDVSSEKPPLPPICLRLQDPKNPNYTFALSQGVGDQYLLLIRADCRVGQALHPVGGTPALIAWRNTLYNWNSDLWGCTDHPATGLGLVSTTFDITSVEASRLIDLYLTAATKVLELNSDEVEQLRQDLERLAKIAVTNESNESVLSSCGQDAATEADATTAKDASSVDATDAANAPDTSAPDANDAADAGPDDAVTSADADDAMANPDAEGGSD